MNVVIGHRELCVFLGLCAFTAGIAQVACGGGDSTALTDPGTGSTGDGGTAADGSTDPDSDIMTPPNEFDTPSVCTSRQTSKVGRGVTMAPGQACNACHAKQGEPQFPIAGTVYPTGHEPNNCVSLIAAGATVVAVDANGGSHTIVVNNVGTFVDQSRTKWALPLQVKVVDANGNERHMVGAATSADCNSCHTEQGDNSAPGRILMPKAN